MPGRCVLTKSAPDREENMRFQERGIRARAAPAAGAFVLSLALTLGAARAGDKTYVMKVTLPTLNDTPHLFAKNFAAAVERDSGGRIKSEVYPASQLGSIPRQIEGTQFGAIQVANVPPEFFVGVDARFQVMTAPGLVDSLEHGQRVAADPAVLKLMLGLGANKGLHGVVRHLENSDPPPRRLQRKEDSGLRLAVPNGGI
jgi:TRAP-type C4-dicarboxylate transport system substrate-binding protein